MYREIVVTCVGVLEMRTSFRAGARYFPENGSAPG